MYSEGLGFEILGEGDCHIHQVPRCAVTIIHIHQVLDGGDCHTYTPSARWG